MHKLYKATHWKIIQGFGILELIIVMSLIALLGAISVPVYRSYTANAQATEIVLLFDELRSGLQADFQGVVVNECSQIQQRAGGAATVTNPYASVSVDFNATTGGYKPVLLIAADSSRDGTLGMSVAESAYEELNQLGLVTPGAVITDNAISFSAPLSDRSGADCIVAVGNTAPGAAAGTTTASNPTNTNTNPNTQTAQASTIATTSTATTTTSTQITPSCRMVYDAPVTFADAGLIEVDPAPQFNSEAITMPPYECLLCGDADNDVGCTDLDLVLAMTNRCPATQPICLNTARVSLTGEVKSFAKCTSPRDANDALAANPAGACYTQQGGSLSSLVVPQAAGLECNAVCYGDGCNAQTAGAVSAASLGVQGAQGRLVCN